MVNRESISKKIHKKFANEIFIKPSQTKLFIKYAIKYGKLTNQLAVAIVINNKPKIIELT